MKQRRFFVSFDNMNFYRAVWDQCQYNHDHQVNYTAGYVCLMDCGKVECSANDAECKCGPLSANSINYSAAKDLSYTDIDLDTPDMQYYVTAAFRTAIGEGWIRYFRKSMRMQRKTPKNGTPGGALCHVDTPPMEVVRARSRRAEILIMSTFDWEEAGISGTVDILQDIYDELRILKHDNDKELCTDEGIDVEKAL